MAGIYDDDKRGGQELNPGQSSEDKLVTGATDQRAHAHTSAEDLRDAEEAGTNTSDSDKDALSEDGLYRKEEAGNAGGGGGAKGTIMSRSRRFASRNRRKLIIGGIATIGFVAPLIIFFMFLMLALKAPHFVANVTEWQFARVTRALAKSTQRVMTEEAAMKSVDDSTYARLRSRYINMRDNTYKNMERISGSRIASNLQGANKLKYEYQPRGGALGKLGLKRLSSITINGQTTVAPKSLFSATNKYFHPINTAKDRIAFYQSLDDALRVYNPQVNTLVRSQAIKKIVTDRLGSSLAGIIASKFAGKNRLDSSKEMQKQSYETAKPQGKANAAAPDEIKRATQAAIDETDKCIEDASPKGCLARTTTNTDGIPDNTANAVNKAFETGAFTKATTTVVGTLNPIYSVAVPLCLIYTGSILEGDNVNAQSNAAQNSAIMYNSIDAQIKKGNRNTIVNNNGSLSDEEPTADDKERSITPEAAGAAADKLDGPDGNGITKSNAMARARGEDPNTLLGTGTSTQMTAFGGYGDTTIFDTFMPPAVASPLNAVADKMCPVATNLWVGGAVALANLISIAAGAVGSAGTASAAQVGGEVALREAVTKAVGIFTKKIVETFTTKAGARAAMSSGGAFGKKVVKSVLLIEGATYLAKLIVIYNAGSAHNGLAVGEGMANEVDNGNNQLSGTIAQQAYGGRAATYAETAQSNNEDAKARAMYNEGLSPYQRYLAISNPNSLLTRFGNATVMNINRGTVATIISNLGNIFNPVSLTSKLFGSLSSRPAAAASVKTQNYGNVQFYALSVDEDKYIDAHPDMASPSENAYQLEQAGEDMVNAIDKKYSPCMELPIGDLLTKKGDDDQPYLVRKADGDIDASKGICSPQQLSYDNPTYGDRVLRWRLTKYNYNTTIHNLYGIQNAGVTAE